MWYTGLGILGMVGRGGEGVGKGVGKGVGGDGVAYIHKFCSGIFFFNIVYCMDTQ